MSVIYSYEPYEIDIEKVREGIRNRILDGKLEEDYTSVRYLLSYIHTEMYTLLYPNRSKEDTQKVIRNLTYIFREILMARESTLGSHRVLIE